MTWNGRITKDADGIRVEDAGSLDNMPDGVYSFGGHDSVFVNSIDGVTREEHSLYFNNGTIHVRTIHVSINPTTKTAADATVVEE